MSFLKKIGSKFAGLKKIAGVGFKYLEKQYPGISLAKGLTNAAIKEMIIKASTKQQKAQAKLFQIAFNEGLRKGIKIGYQNGVKDVKEGNI